MLVSAVAVAVVAVGVLVVGMSAFQRLMLEHGATTAVTYATFDESITRVLVAASAIAFVGSLALAVVFGRMIERPLDELAVAARRIATGRYDARVRRPGAPELASVADSFNQMAASLQDQERQRRVLILNFAHELRTPLTNLHGYLEGIREGVVELEPAVFASLQDEVARLRRLSESLDALADGADPKQHAGELDVVPIIKALLELSGPRFKQSSIELRVELPARLPARADPDSLTQVVGNLLQNAALLTPQAGPVGVPADQRRESTLVPAPNHAPGRPTGAARPRRPLGNTCSRSVNRYP